MPRKPSLAPGDLVLQRFKSAGYGPRGLGRLLDRSHSQISRLKGGRVPATMQGELLRVAPKVGVELTAEELIVGGRA